MSPLSPVDLVLGLAIAIVLGLLRNMLFFALMELHRLFRVWLGKCRCPFWEDMVYCSLHHSRGFSFSFWVQRPDLAERKSLPKEQRNPERNRMCSAAPSHSKMQTILLATCVQRDHCTSFFLRRICPAKVSVYRGPTSINVRIPSSYIASIISTKRTECAIC